MCVRDQQHLTANCQICLTVTSRHGLYTHELHLRIDMWSMRLIVFLLTSFSCVFRWAALSFFDDYMYSHLVKVKPSTCIALAWYTNHFKVLRHGSHSFTCNTHHACRLPRKRSPDGASTDWGGKHLIAAHYSFIDPKRMKGWVGLI